MVWVGYALRVWQGQESDLRLVGFGGGVVMTGKRAKSNAEVDRRDRRRETEVKSLGFVAHVQLKFARLEQQTTPRQV